MSEAEYSLCRNCCLTLGRLKAGSLFACPEHCRRKVRECLTAFRGRGIRFAELGVSCGRRLLLVYDREMVGELLADGDTVRFLADRGYDCSGTAAAVAELRSRVSGGGDFPQRFPCGDQDVFAPEIPCRERFLRSNRLQRRTPSRAAEEIHASGSGNGD